MTTRLRLILEAGKAIALLVIIMMAVGALGILASSGHNKPPKPIPAPSCAPIPSASAPAPFVLPPPSDFDFNKKDRQVDWCEAHHGVATMTFTIDRSNVICLKRAMVISLPADL